jgi:hypothetical protein
MASGKRDILALHGDWTKIPNQILRVGTAQEVLIYATLVSVRESEHPSDRQLAQSTGLARETVRKHAQGLIQKNIVRRLVTRTSPTKLQSRWVLVPPDQWNARARSLSSTNDEGPNLSVDKDPASAAIENESTPGPGAGPGPACQQGHFERRKDEMNEVNKSAKLARGIPRMRDHLSVHETTGPRGDVVAGQQTRQDNTESGRSIATEPHNSATSTSLVSLRADLHTALRGKRFFQDVPQVVTTYFTSFPLIPEDEFRALIQAALQERFPEPRPNRVLPWMEQMERDALSSYRAAARRPRPEARQAASPEQNSDLTVFNPQPSPPSTSNGLSETDLLYMFRLNGEVNSILLSPSRNERESKVVDAVYRFAKTCNRDLSGIPLATEDKVVLLIRCLISRLPQFAAIDADLDALCAAVRLAYQTGLRSK